MTRRAFPLQALSFPNSIWERLLILAKLHFALTRSSNGIAQTSAFPNRVWERGIGSSEARNAKGVAILKRRVGAAAPTLEKPKSEAINPERVESVGLATNSLEGKDSTFSRLVSRGGKTRVGAARQPFALFLQRLWRCGRGNGIAQTSAFPNRVWEREVA